MGILSIPRAGVSREWRCDRRRGFYKYIAVKLRIIWRYRDERAKGTLGLYQE